MNPKFQASVQSRDDVTFVKLAGVIDEDNELNTLADKLNAGTAVIDVGEIERINSCGVRDWVNWLGKAEKNGAHVVLVECSPAIVAQINLVNNFTGQGVVKSFFAPYFCPNCDLEKVLLVETRDMHGAAPFKAPTCRCDECDGPMDFDDMEESYFAFLANTKKIVTDARVDSVINEFTPTDGDKKLRPRSNPGGGTPPSTKTSSPGPNAPLPSIPALPTMGGSRPGSSPGANGFGSSSTASGVRSSAAAALAELEARRNATSPVPLAPSGRSNAAWFIVAFVLLVATALLGYVLFARK
jgi:anti-anti-sigma regulatory factor